MKEKISILIVNFNSSGFVGLSLYALSKLTKNLYQVFIIDNGSSQGDYKNLLKISKDYKNVFVERREKEFDMASMEHGTALNYLAKKVNTPYFSILDADATWLIKNWDEILIKRINDKVKLIGTQAPAGKSQDFPLMFAILFETETFRKMNIDFRPKDLSKGQDTGFEMREKYLKAGFIGENIEMKNTREYKDGPFNNLICGEYYLEGIDHIFASHFGRGSTLGSSKYRRGWKKIIYNFPVLGNFILDYKGKKEKKEWINICKKIIDKQN
jgi:glycosyltransferase involved in cell wall biosynthesis